MSNRQVLNWALAAFALCIVVVSTFSWMGWYTGKWENQRNEIPCIIHDTIYVKQ